MSKEIITFGDIKIEKKKKKFNCYKNPVPLSNVDIEKALASIKISFEEETISPLLVTCIMMIKLSHYI